MGEVEKKSRQDMIYIFPYGRKGCDLFQSNNFIAKNNGVKEKMSRLVSRASAVHVAIDIFNKNA